MSYIDSFGKRLAQLREQKGVSARDMSLSLGQNPGYINNIENGRNLPSMTVFFYICEYLHIEPYDFFYFEKEFPSEVQAITDNLTKLNHEQLLHLSAIVHDLASHS